MAGEIKFTEITVVNRDNCDDVENIDFKRFMELGSHLLQPSSNISHTFQFDEWKIE